MCTRQTNYVTPRSRTAVTAIDVSALDVGLLDAIVRLVRLLDAPHDRSFFASLIKREIVYRLLCGEQRARLVQMAALGGSTTRIAEALNLLRKNFDQPLHVEAIARELGMSISSFHHHFKSLTAMSPLQYQKQLRLQEARRLMLGEGFDAASAGFRVGYSDASYFSRDYKKIFGAPPIRDIQRLQDATVANAVS